MTVDVLVIGGGPAGATAGSLIKKYEPCHVVRWASPVSDCFR